VLAVDTNVLVYAADADLQFHTADVAEEVILELPHLAGNLLYDAHTAHGIGRICTRDTDFNQFPFLEVIDPLRP
jgi:predicted nucleic acid-binding protein